MKKTDKKPTRHLPSTLRIIKKEAYKILNAAEMLTLSLELFIDNYRKNTK